MFRFYAYYSKTNDPTASTALRSERFTDQAECQGMLDHMLAVEGFTGGGIEQHVAGIGWVLADELDTAIIAKDRKSVV